MSKLYNSRQKKGIFKLLLQLCRKIIGNLYVRVYLHRLLFSISFADIFFCAVSVNMSQEEKRTCLVHRDIYLNLNVFHVVNIFPSFLPSQLGTEQVCINLISSHPTFMLERKNWNTVITHQTQIYFYIKNMNH